MTIQEIADVLEVNYDPVQDVLKLCKEKSSWNSPKKPNASGLPFPNEKVNVGVVSFELTFFAVDMAALNLLGFRQRVCKAGRLS